MTSKRLFLLNIITALFLIFPTSGSAAVDQNDAVYQRFAQKLTDYFSSEEFLQSINDNELFAAMNKNLSPAKQKILTRHLQAVFQIDGLSDYLAREFKAYGLFSDNMKNLSKQEMYDKASTLSYAVFARLVQRGAARLNDDALRLLFTAGLGAMENMNDTDCAAYSLGLPTLSPVSLSIATVRFINSLSDQDAEVFFAISREACAAEINDYPLPRSLSGMQAEIASDALFNQVTDFAKKEPGRGELLVSFLTSPNAYAPAQQCSASKDFFRIILGIDGEIGASVRLLMMQSAQNAQ